MPISIQQIKALADQAKTKVQDKVPGVAATRLGSELGSIPHLLPALAAGGAGGALMGYYSGKDHIEGESPRSRRHRILKNALLGLTLGGTAGAAIPAGVNALTSSAQPMSGFHPLDATANAAVRHWLPAAAGVGGGAVGYHHLSANRVETARNIADRIDPENAKNIRPGEPHPYQTSFMADLRNPGKQQQLLTRIGQTLHTKDGQPMPSAGWAARELAGEAGIHNFPSVNDTLGNWSTKIPGDAARAQTEATQMEDGLRAHLGGQGWVSRQMARLVGRKAPAGSIMSRVLPSGTEAAEMYSKYLRPSVNYQLGSEGLRIGAPLTAGLIGGGMLGANYLQDKLEGN